MIHSLKLVTSAAVLATVAAFNATATPIFGSGLENGLNATSLDGNFNQNVNTDQVANDEIWTLDAVSSANAVMMFELAGFASTNTMGIYQLGNTSNRLELFSGPASQGYRTNLMHIGNNFIATYFNDIGLFNGQSSINFGGDNNFGFYLTTGGGNTFYSEESLNSDTAADGTSDHLVTYQGDNVEMMDPDGDGNYGLFTSNNYILAWEDLLLSSSDRDYADMVVMIESFIPTTVSEPGTLAILGLGLVGFGLVRRRRS